LLEGKSRLAVHGIVLDALHVYLIPDLHDIFDILGPLPLKFRNVNHAVFAL
jgi:hypothetical protein